MLKSEKLKMAAEAVIMYDKITPERKLVILRELIDIIDTAEFTERSDRGEFDNEKD